MTTGPLPTSTISRIAILLGALSLMVAACTPGGVGEGATTIRAAQTTTTGDTTPLTLAASDLTIPPRFLTERGEPAQLDFVANCLRDAGFDVEVDYDDQALISYVPGQEQAYDEAYDRCQQAAVDAGLQVPYSPYTPQELILMYHSWERVEACMLEHGYPVPPKPSLEQFIESGGTWHPYNIVFRGVSIERQRSLEADCPADLAELIPQVLTDLGDTGSGR